MKSPQKPSAIRHYMISATSHFIPGVPCPTSSEVFAICSSLGAHKLLLTEASRRDTSMLIRLNCSKADMLFALKQTVWKSLSAIAPTYSNAPLRVYTSKEIIKFGFKAFTQQPLASLSSLMQRTFLSLSCNLNSLSLHYLFHKRKGRQLPLTPRNFLCQNCPGICYTNSDVYRST